MTWLSLNPCIAQLLAGVPAWIARIKLRAPNPRAPFYSVSLALDLPHTQVGPSETRDPVDRFGIPHPATLDFAAFIQGGFAAPRRPVPPPDRPTSLAGCGI